MELLKSHWIRLLYCLLSIAIVRLQTPNLEKVNPARGRKYATA